MTVTLITSGLCGFLLFILSYNVVRWRAKTKTLLGEGTDENLLRAIRAQANLVEYAPIVLITLAGLEYMNASHWLVLNLGAWFVIGRALHGYGLGFTDGSVRFYRMVGTLLTWIVLLVGSGAALVVGYNL